jgi:hypothetical protein
MKGTEFCESIGPSYSKDRQAAIVQAVRDGLHLPIIWRPVTIRHQDGRAFTLRVANDALKIGELDNFVRVNVSHQDAQLIADILDARLPTTKICDTIHQQADMLIEPWTSNPDSQMASTDRMQQHSTAVSDRIGPPAKLAPLVSPVGKDWVLTNGYKGNANGANYGWYSKSAPYSSPCGLKMWQTLGLAHDIFHTDYSQTLRLVHRLVGVDDPNARECRELELDAMLQDPDLSKLVSYEGALKWVRHPGVPAS